MSAKQIKELAEISLPIKQEWTLVPLRTRGLILVLNDDLTMWMNEQIGVRGTDWDLKFTEYGNIMSGVAKFKKPEHATLFTLKWLA